LKIKSFKLTAVFLLGALMVAYTNCGQPFSQPSELLFVSNIYGGGSQASYAAFEQTVYPITRANCINCHSEQQPLHAADDVTVAHDAVIKGFKVNFSNIPASRMVAKLRDENHNCWGVCSENAKQMEDAISEWNQAIKDSGLDNTPVDTAIYTAETDTMEMEFLDASNPLKSNSVKLNIEAAMLRAPMVVTRPVGADAYVSVPNNNLTALGNADPNAGTALMNFKVPTSGSYTVWGLVHAPADVDNLFFVNLRNPANASVVGGVRTWNVPVGTKFEWRQVPNTTANLVAGATYTLELRQGEDGARAAGFIVTSDTSFNGSEVGDFFGITLAFDLSQQLKIPGISFQIDVVDYDLYSYKFSKPRIVSSTATTYVKGVKIYVNDIYSPQHSTYTLVDKIVSPTDNILSNYSMIVIKDKSMNGDQIKFSFDQISLSNGMATGGGTTGAIGGGVETQTSLVAFQSTVYPISRNSANSCVGCHTAVSPRHSSDNTLTAHNAALTVVDFNSPQNSRIVTKLRVDRHNCGANCDSLANDYQNMIIQWRNRRQ
jgi:hypothetical protein